MLPASKGSCSSLPCLEFCCALRPGHSLRTYPLPNNCHAKAHLPAKPFLTSTHSHSHTQKCAHRHFHNHTLTLVTQGVKRLRNIPALISSEPPWVSIRWPHLFSTSGAPRPSTQQVPQMLAKYLVNECCTICLRHVGTGTVRSRLYSVPSQKAKAGGAGAGGSCISESYSYRACGAG